MVPEPLEKVSLICNADGRRVWETNDKEIVIIEYEDAGTALLSEHLCGILLRHGVRSAFREHYAGGAFAASALSLLKLRTAVRVRDGDVAVSFVTETGRTINRQEAERLKLVSPKKLDGMVDDATHAGRVLRAHLELAGLELVEAQFRFGLLPNTALVMESFDPLLCRFWDPKTDAAITDFRALAERLGGK